MTAATAASVATVVPVPRAPADDAAVHDRAPARPAGRAAAYQRVLHQLVRREFRLLADLLAWAPPDEPARIAALTRHADLVSRLLVAHHRVETEALWPALLAAVPDRYAADARAAVARCTDRCASVDVLVRDLGTATRQWSVTGTPASRDAVARTCREVADAVDVQTADEERDLLPLLDAHLDAARWSAVAAASPVRLPRRQRGLVLGMALEDCCAGDRGRLLDGLSPGTRLAWRLWGARRYRAAVVRLRGAPPAA
jgi:hypothetical protein